MCSYFNKIVDKPGIEDDRQPPATPFLASYSPPLAGEDLLLEDRPIGTEETDGEEKGGILGLLQTDMIGLAVSLGVGVEAAKDFPLAVEAGLRDRGEDGIVLARLPGYCLPQTFQVVLGPTDRQH